MKRAIDALQAQNRVLAERVLALEAQKSERTRDRNAAAATANTDGKDDQQLLEQRVKELEISKVAQEDAVRSIIKDSVRTLGSKINEAVSFGGNLGVTLGRSTNFAGERQRAIGLESTSFEFEIQTNDWALGHIKLDYVDGKDISFPTTTGTQAHVDRLNIDTAYVTVGNQLRFPPQLTAGRVVLPFGTSTGHPVADALSVSSPLTIDIFEMRHQAISLSLAFPTLGLKPPVPPVVAPPVTPLVINPLISSISQNLGYRPLPTRLKPLPRIASPLELPAFNAGVYVFDGRTPGGLRNHVGGTVGYLTKGNCGRRYEDLPKLGLCPWTINADLSYNSSIFNSRFLQTEYDRFLTQIGRVPGVAASIKASLGPFGLVGEWNAATKPARFVDDIGASIAIKPSAWQVSLGYQLGWNPWVQEIGA